MVLKMLSRRQRDIIEMLLEAPEPVTVRRLAEKTGVSGRTIHRELSRLKRILKDSGLSLNPKAGVGITIEGREDAISTLKGQLRQTPLRGRELTPSERDFFIIQELLSSKTIHKLTFFAHKLSVTEATISNDMDRIALWFEKRGLSLVRKPGIGVYLKGSETAFRRAILDFLYENLGEDRLLTLVRSNPENITGERIDVRSEIKSRLLNFIDGDVFTKLEAAVDKTLEETGFEIVDSSYVGLMVHLALAVERLKMGEKIYFDKGILEKLKSAKEYEIAVKISDRLEEVFGISVPIHEIGYITMHLKGAKLRKGVDLDGYIMESEDLKTLKIARILVDCVEEELNLSLSKDLKLMSGLVAHLEPAITRLTMGMDIRNPVLGQLKAQYGHIFSATKRAGVRIQRLIGVPIPDSEIGFLTMHIAAAVERANTMDFKARVLIVCSSGIGSSRILAARLKKSVDNIEIVDEVSALSFEKNKTAGKDIDLVISTVPLNYEGEVVVVTPVLFPEEIEKIRSIIKNIAAGRRPAEEKRRGKFLPWLEDKLEITARIAGDIVGILKNFKVVKVSKIETPADIIKRASEKNFLPQGSDSKEVFEALTRRERLGSTLIPEVNLALLHARTDGVKQPFIGLLTLDKSVLISGDEVDRIIVLLAPKSLLPEELELISSFSASIIENREFNAIIREADENKFLEYLRNLMGGYYNEVINKGGEK